MLYSVLVVHSVEDILRESVDTRPTAALAKPINLARQANRKRQNQRPTHPTSLDFDIEEEHIQQDFIRADITVNQRRHLIFATQQQLDLLACAKTWYMHATFVRPPFTQLFSIHAFVRHDNSLKQVPLVFAVMSGRKRRDYKKLLFRDRFRRWTLACYTRSLRHQ